MQGAVETGKTSLDNLSTLQFVQSALKFIVACQDEAGICEASGSEVMTPENVSSR